MGEFVVPTANLQENGCLKHRYFEDTKLHSGKKQADCLSKSFTVAPSKAPCITEPTKRRPSGGRDAARIKNLGLYPEKTRCGKGHEIPNLKRTPSKVAFAKNGKSPSKMNGSCAVLSNNSQENSYRKFRSHEEIHHPRGSR